MTNPLALIVEDDEDLTVIFSKALEAAGYDTLIEMEGDKAWSRLETIQPALLVLDLHLPNLSGLDILRRMRDNDRYAKVITLAISADARMAEMASADADLVLIKPITFSQMRDLSSRFSQLKDTMGAAPKETATAAAEEFTTPGAPGAIPVTQVVRTEESAPEAPLTEAPAAEPPATEDPVSEPPKVEAPAAEPSAAEDPVSEPPKVEAPAAELPAAEDPVSEPPKVEALAAELPTAEDPVSEPSKVKAPKKTKASKSETPEVELRDAQADQPDTPAQ